VHLIYTLNQAYMAMEAGASFICPLAGRMQDQGHDAIQLFEQIVDVIDRYGYESKVMFSSVRHAEHVRQAMLTGVHVCTMPYGVMKNLCENTLTAAGTAQFREHTALMTMRVKDVIRDSNPVCETGETLSSAMVKMTESRLGTVTLVDGKGASRASSPTATCVGSSSRAAVRSSTRSSWTSASRRRRSRSRPTRFSTTRSRCSRARRSTASSSSRQKKPVGVLDVQDLIKLGLLGQEHL
jgi:hypothetical protein